MIRFGIDTIGLSIPVRSASLEDLPKFRPHRISKGGPGYESRDGATLPCGLKVRLQGGRAGAQLVVDGSISTVARGHNLHVIGLGETKETLAQVVCPELDEIAEGADLDNAAFSRLDLTTDLVVRPEDIHPVLLGFSQVTTAAKADSIVYRGRYGGIASLVVRNKSRGVTLYDNLLEKRKKSAVPPADLDAALPTLRAETRLRRSLGPRHQRLLPRMLQREVLEELHLRTIHWAGLDRTVTYQDTWLDVLETYGDQEGWSQTVKTNVAGLFVRRRFGRSAQASSEAEARLTQLERDTGYSPTTATLASWTGSRFDYRLDFERGMVVREKFVRRARPSGGPSSIDATRRNAPLRVEIVELTPREI